MNFYWFDVFILGFTLLLGLKGILNGLIKEAFGLLGIVGGVFIASKYSNQAALFIQDTFYKIQNESLASFVGFLALLILFWIFCLLFGNLLSKMVKLSGLGFLDRLGGFLFGGVKVFLIFAILVFCISRINFLNEKLENFAKDSYTLSLLKNAGSYIMNQPLAEKGLQNLHEEVKENLQELNSDLNHTQEEL
ncbi:CvpA family protein [Campylobacter cuniculorum]|uniref:CvpA family protein n=2 Tax=Campylobacter cuniculorum TaxID=374106 RepID=A0ABX6TZ34_9BACT|nr:CvpA family protein [Campylobacter cuniculorum]ARJ55820.1 putative membrane protein, CvpA family [Campylobacter cuniculorum DSM 23162 = LMG 24588]QOR05037.1 CvpA family protein [Campylobacter cuniculorum]